MTCQKKCFLVVPVVIKDDLLAEGDQSGWNVLTYAAAPATWGQAIEVPDIILYFTGLLSWRMPEGEQIGENAANISTLEHLYLAAIFYSKSKLQNNKKGYKKRIEH